jgi:putative sigma-54 modulation protein
MQIHIQSIHFTANTNLLADTNEKLEKLEKLYDRIERCNVTLKLELNEDKRRYFAEIRLAIPGEDLFASEKAESFDQAIDHVVSDLKKQLVKRKEKMNSFDRTEVTELPDGSSL